jgi:hypothetical protein
VFRDVVAMFVADILRNATVALAAVEISCGTSLSEFAAWAVERAAVVQRRIAEHLVALVRVLVRVFSALKALFGKARDMLKAYLDD